MCFVFACTGTSLPPAVTSFERALPSSASVTVHDNRGKWGDVVVVLDSDENMSVETPGETLIAAQAWILENSQVLIDAGLDYVLLCHSAVNTDPSTGEVLDRPSEMVPTRPGGTITSVRTGQESDAGRSTTVSCET
jgi:hypothetical protein